MGISSNYEVVPVDLLNAIGRDDDAAQAFESLWVYGGSMYSWFSELSESEINDIIAFQGVKPLGVARLRELLANAVAYPSVYLEKTQMEHRSMLASAFAGLGKVDARRLADIVIWGEREWGADSSVSVVTPETCRRIAGLFAALSPEKIVGNFDLGEREPPELWRESLLFELKRLIECYTAAADAGHQVVVGSS